jgi:signal transduction histidine kinase
MDSDPLRASGRLAALAESGLMDSPSQESLDRCARIAGAALGAPVVLVSLVDDHRQFFSSALGLPEPWATCRETPLSHSFCQHVVQNGEPLIVTDARADPRVSENLAVRDLSVLAYAGIPILSIEGYVVGSFCAIDTVPRLWSEREIAILCDLASVVSDEIELRRRACRAERAERRLSEVTRQLNAEHEVERCRTQNATHDIRTPLNVITLGIQNIMLHDGTSAYPELMRLLQIVKRNVDHAACLLSSAGAPASQSGEEKARTTVDLAELTRETCTDLDVQPGRAQLDFSDVARERLDVLCDTTSLRRCVENLVSNALRFAQSKVSIRLLRSGREAILAVEDDGSGLPDAAAHDRVWEPNVRYHLGEGKSGSGIGLTIVRAIVERTGGHVEASRSALGGARFVLRFPIAP